MTVRQTQEHLPGKLIAGMQIYKLHHICSLHFHAVPFTTGERATKTMPGNEQCICFSIQAETKT